MSRFLVFVVIFFSLRSYSQQQNVSKGIKFINTLSWSQIKQKARQENKFIFLDVFATWCKPCKQMEEKVYTVDSIGNFINEHFISVKVQIDTNKKDNENIRQWYQVASQIEREYKVSVLPTYLFFAPSGKIINREQGTKSISDFLDLAKKTVDTTNNYYKWVSDYEEGKRSYNYFGNLALRAKALGDEALAAKVADDYINNFLLHKPLNELLGDNENLKFLYSFTSKTSDPAFRLVYDNINLIDSLKGEPGFSNMWINLCIYNEFIEPAINEGLKCGSVPKWYKLKKKIQKAFNYTYADYNILCGKVRWYNSRKDWNKYFKYALKKEEKYSDYKSSIRDNLNVNVLCWNIFNYSTKSSYLNRAISLMEKSTSSPQYEKYNGWLAAALDTYANLLYKSGKKTRAIEVETKAIETRPDMKEHVESLNKMKRNEPTWIAHGENRNKE